MGIRQYLIVFLAITAVLLGVLWVRTNTVENLKVAFPLFVFKPSPEFVDAQDLETIYEYYLLENLAIGLLRDSQRYPDGYEPLLAESWHHPDPTTWVFKIREGISWSNGDPITIDQITNHLKRLSEVPFRHITLMKNLSGISHTEKTREVTLIFSTETDRTLLHELSIADAVLTHPSKTWEVTTGPYVIPQTEKPDSITLIANPRSLLFSKDMSQKIELRWPSDDSEWKAELGAELDFVRLPELALRSPPYSNIPLTTGELVCGQYNFVHYFSVSPNSSLAKSDDLRIFVGNILQQAFKEFEWPKNSLLPNTQLIPLGYSGHLTQPPAPPPLEKRSQSITIQIGLHKNLEPISGLSQHLSSYASQYGIDLRLSFDVNDPNADLGHRTFVGNQTNPLGTWSFFISGRLAPYRTNLTPLLETANQTSDFQPIHRYVLQNSLIIPVALERSCVILRKGLSIDRWNKFDMRARFYDIRKM